MNRPEIPIVSPRIFRALRTSDPGLLRLRQAARTALAALLAPGTVALMEYALYGHVYIETLPPAMLTGMLLVMTATGESRKIQKEVMITAGGTGILMVMLEALSHGNRPASTLVLMTVAFLAFYIRRFGVRYIGLGIYALVIFLIASVMNRHPGTWPRMTAAVGGAVAATYLVNFYVLPASARRAFLDSIPPFLHAAEMLIGHIRDMVQSGTAPHRQPTLLRDDITRLQRRTAVSENILGGLRPGSQDTRKPFRECCVALYRINSSLVIVADNLAHAILKHGHPGDRTAEAFLRIIAGLQQAISLLAERPCRLSEAGRAIASTRREIQVFMDHLENNLGAQQQQTFALLRPVFVFERLLDALEQLRDNLIQAVKIL